MQALVVQSSGEVEVNEVPDPEPGPGQVLVETEVAGAGFVDVMLRRGQYAGSAAGMVPGVEVVGRVRAAGADVPADLVGQRVLAQPSLGGYAELVAVDAGRVLPLPEDTDAASAVALGVNALVAEVSLSRAGVRNGTRVLVRGASGGVGLLATQVAAARGAEVTAVTSSAERADRLRALGATTVVDRTTATVSGGPYDVVVDPVAGPDMPSFLELLDANGHYVACGAAAGTPPDAFFHALLAAFFRSPTLMAFSLSSVTQDELRASWREITTLWAKGALEPVVDERLPLAEAEKALVALEAGTPFGKVVLTCG
ncbi:NADPH:quinone reductase [Lentzea fradiae]|uniref:NADPH:quinone reductase n=1 Tax=Lentzea fradiae TaxID=200378 RepID=A0A1G7KET7_9PSEU|nr:zinc-binding dehydrogenase [Lentzea fradiae]SDF35697.1 NADPH:quinone reductase [Lentzea fradiae]